MSLPTTRLTFGQYCLRRLGAPVLEINLDEDQIEDRIDDALQWFWDYHSDGQEKQYYKHIITANDFPKAVHSLILHNGGTGYSNSDTIAFSTPGTGATANLTTYANGTIAALNLITNGDEYAVAPTLAITTVSGSGANVEALTGGFITMPENIIGVVGIFDLTNAITNISNMFSIQYQIALNEIWSLSSYSMVPYYTTIMHLSLIQQLLVGQQPVRYNRHRNRMHLDMAWQRVKAGNYLVVEAYQVIDPNVFPNVWSDRWLMKYGTALLKKQWGMNLKKFGQMQLPGGTILNGQIIYDEATDEIAEIEQTVIDSYSIPNSMMIG